MPPIQNIRIVAVYAGVQALAAACLVYLVANYPISSLLTPNALLYLALNLIASYSVVRVSFSGTPYNVSAGFAVSGAIVVLFNPLVAAVLVALGTVNERDFKRLRPWRYTLFNRSMFLVTAAAAGLLFERLGVVDPPFDETAWMAHVGAALLCYFLVNHVLLQALVSAENNTSFLGTFPIKGDLLLGFILQALVSILLVLAARQHQALALLLVGAVWGVRFALQKIVELREINEQLVQSFADALDMRDHDTAGHTRRVAALARLIGAELRLRPRQLDNIYAAGSLHDLGKIGIPDSILLKPGVLERNEWGEMKRHPVLGASLLAPYKHLQEVTAIMRHHHERFDGRGYPDGLPGPEIPVGARVIAVADTFLVITDGRRYRPARSIDDAIAEIERCSGSQFDPRVVEAFLKLDPAGVLVRLNALDPLDKRPVLEAIRPGPVWGKLLRLSAA